MIARFEAYAYEAIFVAVLLDTIGLPVPGEVVLLAAGFLVSTGRIEPIPAILVAALAAVLGDSVTYWLGRRAGMAGQRRLVGLYCTWTACTLGSARCLERAEGLLRRFRGWVVLVAKFIAGARVFMPPVAGVSGLSYGRFLILAAAGSLLWTTPVRGLLPILRRALSIAIDRKYHADVRHHTGRCRLVAIEPPNGLAIDLLDFSHTAELIEQGHASAMVALEEWLSASAAGRDDRRCARG